MMSTRLSFTEHPSPLHIGLFFIGLLIVSALVWSFFTKDSDEAKETATSTATSTREEIALDPRLPYRAPVVNGVSVTADEVSVSDQKAGETVSLTKVALTKDGWIVVREGELATGVVILGAARFDAGVWQGTVPLLRALEAGKTYHAVVYHDDGDKIFDFKKDMPVVHGDILVGMNFQAY